MILQAEAKQSLVCYLGGTSVTHLYNDMLHFSIFFHAFQRATALLDRTGPRSCVHKYGHTGILTMDLTAQVQGISTFKATFNSPKSLGVRQKGNLG